MTESTHLRVDAERNRQRIVDAACELFGSAGLDVPLEDVARRAGVGIATLYRRFPSRAELITAAFTQKIAAYLALIDRTVDRADAWEGVVALVEGICSLQATDAGLRELLAMSFTDVPEIEEMTSAAQARVDALLERAKQAGALRADAVAEDLVLIVLGNAEVIGRTGEAASMSSRRYAALMLAGLRARPDDVPLPDPPSPEALRLSLRR